MNKTVREIAELVGGEVSGNGGLVIRGISGIREVKEGDITFLAHPRYVPLLSETKATAVIVGRDIQTPDSATLIRTENPSLAFTRLLDVLGPKQHRSAPGVHPTAVIGQNVRLGSRVSLGAHAVVEDGARVGDDSVIGAGCYVGVESAVGNNCVLYPGVVLRERVSVGDRVIIHSGAVIGADGFGFIPVDGKYVKIPQTGTVVLEDDVEIGANVTIDRARFEKTLIKRGTKIDNLVQIAHNVVVGEDCVIVAQAGIAGSTALGNRVTLAAQAGCVGHIHVGDGAIIAAQAGVTKDVEAQDFVIGAPAVNHLKFKRNVAMVNRLPKLQERVEQLEKTIRELEARLKESC